MKTLYFNETGPLIRYADGLLYVEDLNPQIETKWCMSRKEMLLCGWKFIRAALT
jgi:hypothetical protein